MPSFCAVKLNDNNKTPAAQAFIRQFGWNNWLHMHHYCYGLNFINRARFANDRTERSYYQQQVIGEYQYIFRATEPRFWMRAQMYVELGNHYLEMGRPESALPLYEDAIRFNRSFVPAYLALVSHYRRAGNRTRALEFATEGLRHSPSSDALKKAFLDNGGREPFPEPAAGPPRRSDMGRSARRDVPAAVEREPRVETSRSADSSNHDEAEQRSRSCRFCPPEEVEQRWRDTFEQ